MAYRLAFLVLMASSGLAALALDLRGGSARSSQQGRADDATWKGGPIDVVIPHATGSASLIADDVKDVERDRDPGDLKYQLRAFKSYAPWVNHIYILVNGDMEPADWFAEPSKTSFVNRCALPGMAGNCPTRNSQAVVSVAYQIPGLSENFILTDDDDVLVKPAHVVNFFDLKTSKPWNPKWSEPSDMYDDMGNVLSRHPELTSADIPKRMFKMDPGHTFIPMSRSSWVDFEKEYPKWFAFVRSHKGGRYCSSLDEAGTASSDAMNCLEEMMESAMYHYWTQHPERAPPMDPKTHPGADSVYDYSGSPADRVKACIEGARSKHTYLIANFNDVYSHDPATFAREVEEVHRVLEDYFPAQP